MSNVLIGIIGVILFIGLALAGAMFIGPNFQNATVQNNAAGVTAVLAQVVSGISLGVIQSGNDYDVLNGSISQLMVNGLLKEVPQNIVQTGTDFTVVSSTNLGSAPAAGQRADYVMVGLGSINKPVCDAIEEQTGGTTTQTYADAAAVMAAIVGHQMRNVGCFRVTAGLPNAPLVVANDYVAYAGF